jgi:uncharacterized protein YyaL (SSP411 family)
VAAARRWAKVIEANLPPQTGRTFKRKIEEAMPEVLRTGGTYAENYGRAISFFVHLYRATQESRYLHRAQQIAGEAVEKLYVESEHLDNQGNKRNYGLFRGHPAKPYYEAVDGVGILMFALLELDAPAENLGGAF